MLHGPLFYVWTGKCTACVGWVLIVGAVQPAALGQRKDVDGPPALPRLPTRFLDVGIEGRGQAYLRFEAQRGVDLRRVRVPGGKEPIVGASVQQGAAVVGSGTVVAAEQ